MRNPPAPSTQKFIRRGQYGRIRPFVLGAVILIAGLLLDRWWWQVGGVILLVLLTEEIYRYRTR